MEFSRDIRPILNQNCVACHGGVRQKNGVSFIFREEALGTGKSGRTTIVPGNPDASEFMARLTSTDPEARMPYHAPPLPPQQISLLRRWIKEGAKWEDYWAFVPPAQQPLPQVKHPDWARQPMDRFVLARLEKEGLAPAPESDKATLLRRVSFDLTGLPPTPEEEAAYLADSSPLAYEKQVDRLLASPHFGERWASMWLDLARYADSKGYEADYDRPGVWPYRDWVIDAFNRNLPYDQFVIKQLARRFAAPCHLRGPDRHFLPPSNPQQRRRGHRRRGISHGRGDGPRGHNLVGVERPHHELRAVPLPSLRSHSPHRLLQVDGVLQYPARCGPHG